MSAPSSSGENAEPLVASGIEEGLESARPAPANATGLRPTAESDFSAQTPPPPPHVILREAGEGVPLAEVLSLPLSKSLRGVMAVAQETAERERLRGLMGTGLLLLEIVETGRKAPPSDPFYAPRFLANQVAKRAGERFESARARFFELNRLAPDVPAQLPDIVSSSLWNVLQEALKLPMHDGILSARHLIVALLTYQPPGRDKAINAWEILDDAGIDRAALLAEFLDSLRERAPLPEREAWAALARNYRVDTPAPGGLSKASARAVSGPIIAGYGADTPSGRAADDCLDLGATVDAMANLIASPQLDGNLSLGVFGHWGSGKSFFMRRLRGAIDDLTLRAGRQSSANPTAAPAYWTNVAQVEFNAWHYVDANLWASLMAHLLEELRRWDPAARLLAVQTPIERAINRLQIASAARDEAEQRERSARESKAAAETALHNTKQRLDAVTRRLADAAACSLWSMIGEEIIPDRNKALKILRSLQLSTDDANESIEAVFSQVRDLTTTGNRIHVVLQQLIRSKDAGTEITRMAMIVGVPLVVLIMLAFTPWGEWLRQTGAVLATALATTVGVAARAAAWIREHAARVLEQLAPLTAVRASIEQHLGEAELRKAKNIADLQQQVVACRDEVAAAAAELAAREKDVRDAIVAVGDALSGRAIQRFIEQRLATGDYQKHLGLIATIRRDFEQLSDLVRAHNATRLGLAREVEKIEGELRQARPDITAAELTSLFTNIGINRIVLYIDDLDRCPSNRVVEVLQAIHLLVSFPIFVVVVGVDSRWMAHSLAKEYPALLTRATKEQEVGTGWSRDAALSVVTTSDYLEKIFQIPFWVPPLNTQSAQKLIVQMVGAQTGTMPTRLAIPSNIGATIPPVQAGASAPNAETNVVSTIAPPRSAGTNGATANEPQAQTHAQPETPPTLARPELLRISADEQEAMESLAAIIGRSPRATKRFVNSYRLLKAALTPSERARLGIEDDQLGGLGPAMFLLSIVTGTPSLAAPLVSMLARNDSALALDLLFALGEWSADDVMHAEPARRIAEFHASEAAARWEALTARDLLPWVSRISQFSFENLEPQDTPVRPEGAPRSGLEERLEGGKPELDLA